MLLSPGVSKFSQKVTPQLKTAPDENLLTDTDGACGQVDGVKAQEVWNHCSGPLTYL